MIGQLVQKLFLKILGKGEGKGKDMKEDIDFKLFNRNILMDVLRADEGSNRKMYLDTEGYWTIGIGHLITKDPNKKVALSILDDIIGRNTNGVITAEEEQVLFHADINSKLGEIYRNALIKRVFDGLDENRRIALISMCYQMGVPGTATFKNSMKFIEDKQWKNAGANLRQSKWYRQTPNRAERVIKIFENGNFDHYKREYKQFNFK